MPERKNVPRHGHRGGVIVDAHRQKARPRTGARHRDRQRAGLAEHGVNALRIAQRRRQDDAVDAGSQQFAHHFIFMLIGIAFLDHQLHVAQARLLQAADQKFAQNAALGLL